MNKLTAIAGVVLVSAGIASAKGLTTYRTTYEKQMEEIILLHGMKMSDLGQQYIKALDVLLAKVKTAGDLDKTTAVMNEIEQFRKEKAMPDKAPALLDIHNLQSSYTKQASTHETDKAKKIISLTRRYDQALERLQKSLVSSGKLDDARAVQEERQRVQNSEIVSAAKNSIVNNIRTQKQDKVSLKTNQRHKLQQKEK